MLSRRDVLRAIAATAAAMALAPEARAEAAAPRVISPFVEGGEVAGLGLWTRHATPDARLALPGRAHAIAMHPDAKECVAVARRPGRFGIAVDLERFERSGTFEATDGRHFFGHGVFADEGRLFLTTENDYEAGQGVVGLRDATRGYRSIGEWRSGGVGPHDLALSADGAFVFVANGGIDMRPDTGRAKLNEGLITSSIARVAIATGRQEAQVDLGEDMASLSIRHLAALAGGLLAFGCQDTVRDGIVRPLAGLVGPDDGVRWLAPPPGGWASLSAYIGEIAVDDATSTVAATAPLAGLCVVWDARTGGCLASVALADCCGVGVAPSGTFIVSSGRGDLVAASPTRQETILSGRLGFDNHLAVA
jgi:hypothetical protein